MSNHSPLPWSELDQLVTIFRWLKPDEKEGMTIRYPEIMRAVWDTVFALVYCDVADANNYPVTEQLSAFRAVLVDYSYHITEIVVD